MALDNLPPKLPANVKYKAYCVLGPRIYKIQWVEGEIPEYINYGVKTLKLKMVLWECRKWGLILKSLVYR